MFVPVQHILDYYGILNCKGVSNALFLANKPKTYTIFGKNVTEQRFEEVRSELDEKLGDWKPTFNNLRSLYIKSGSDWKLTPIPNAKELSKKEAWADMPKEAVIFHSGFNSILFCFLKSFA